MPKPRRSKRPAAKRKRHSYLIFFGMLALVFFLALCTVKQFQNTDFPTAKEDQSELSKKKLTENPVNPGIPKKSGAENKPLYDNFDGYISTITAAPQFSQPVFTSGQQGELVEHGAYSLSYNEEHEQAYWVSYKLTASMLGGSEKRRDNFKADPKVSTLSASPSDYRLSGYDRGHLAPAGDFTYDATAMDESFYMSNICPQTPSFNRGIWKKLEDQVRYWAKDNKEIYVVTGPVIKKKEISLGVNEVTVPEYFYKIILDIHPPEYKAIAFLMKNEKSGRPLLDFAITVDSLERFTGLDFFPMLPDSLENRLENMNKHEIWFE